MNARECLRAMIRDNRGDMTVWSKPEIDDAFAAYDAERHAEVTRANAALIEDAACDADWDKTPAYCRGLRAGAELLLAKTEKATPEFFRPGRTYISPYSRFQCIEVSRHPGTGERRVIGWWGPRYGGQWEIRDINPHDHEHGVWTDVTPEPAARGGEVR